MSLLSRFFYRRPPDGLLEFVDRVYVFDSCFSTDVLPEGMYQVYLHEIINELHEEFPESSFLAFNFREGEKQSQFAKILCEYDVTVMDYPRQYEGCPLLPLSLVQHFLRVCESWLSLGNNQNVILLHCERGGWPLLAFLLASFLIFRKLHSGERRTLEIVHREAPKGFLQLLSPLNPFPSQLRYLQYVARRNLTPEWPPPERALSLDCVILRAVPSFDSQKGCRPAIRIFGRNLRSKGGLSTQMLFSMPKKSKVRYYRQVDCDVIKIDVQCLVQGDVVLECVHVDLDSEREIMMFRVMLNTAFIRSNILILNSENLDILWDSKERYPKGFRAEVLFGEIENVSLPKSPTTILTAHETGGLPIEAFSKVQELFSGVDLADNSDDAAMWLLKQLSVLSDAKEFSRFQNKVSSYLSSADSEEDYNVSSAAESSDEASDIIPKSPVSPVDPTKLFKPDIVENTHLEIDNPHNEDFSSEPLVVASEKNVFPPLQSLEPLLPPPSISSECLLLPPPPPPPPPLSSSSSSPPPPPPPPPALSHNSISASGPPPPPSPPPPPPPPPPFLNHNSNNPPRPPPPPPHPPSLNHDSNNVPRPPPSPSPLPSLNHDSNNAPRPPPPPPPPSLSHNSSNAPRPPPPPPPPPSLSHNSSNVPGPPPPPPPPPPPSLSHNSSNALRPPPPPPPPPSLSHNSSNAPRPPPPPPASPPSLVHNSSNACRPPPPPPPPPSLSHNFSNKPSITPKPPPPPLSGPPRPGAPPPPPPPQVPKPPSACPPPPPLGHIVTPSPPPLPGMKGINAPPPPTLSAGKGKVSLGPRGLGIAVGSNVPKKASLKPLHWVKVTRAVQGSLWADSQKQENQSSKAPEIDISELESLFSVVSLDGKGTSKAGVRRGSKINKPEKVQLVDLRRAYNCEIMLTKIKIPLPDMINAVLALDTSALDIDQVENLIKFCPTKDEIEILKNYAGNKEMLGKCEQFFMELMKVPRVEAKLRVFAFKITFSSQVDDLRSNLSTINDATREVKESAKLRQIMQTILTLGNALNQGTARGSAVGFKLDSLLKLSDTRAKDNKMTLMHYLGKLIAEKMPELLHFDKELSHLEAASKIQLKHLAEEMQAVSKGLEKVEQELAASENDGDISTVFQKELKNFLSAAEAQVRSLISLYSEVGRNADSLSQYFGEDPARCPFEQVTQILIVFVKLFNKSRDDNEREAEAEKRKLERERATIKQKVVG
ncbi:hypothetical protein ACFE04_002172 [Oxalis oulophora]